MTASFSIIMNTRLKKEAFTLTKNIIHAIIIMDRNADNLRLKKGVFEWKRN